MFIKLFVTFHTFQELLARETILSIHTEMKGKTFLDRYKKVFRFIKWKMKLLGQKKKFFYYIFLPGKHAVSVNFYFQWLSTISPFEIEMLWV